MLFLLGYNLKIVIQWGGRGGGGEGGGRIGITINIIWFFHQMVIAWPLNLNLTSCGYSKFMKLICAFDNLANFVHVEIQL